ncbi:MAG: hypothetical protein IKS68_06195 [Mailhella sp.]|nr:hypothetical protein [Mailhella sp.]
MRAGGAFQPAILSALPYMTTALAVKNSVNSRICQENAPLGALLQHAAYAGKSPGYEHPEEESRPLAFPFLPRRIDFGGEQGGDGQEEGDDGRDAPEKHCLIHKKILRAAVAGCCLAADWRRMPYGKALWQRLRHGADQHNCMVVPRRAP